MLADREGHQGADDISAVSTIGVRCMILTADEVMSTSHDDFCQCGCREVDSTLIDSHEELRAELAAAQQRIVTLHNQLRESAKADHQCLAF